MSNILPAILSLLVFFSIQALGRPAFEFPLEEENQEPELFDGWLATGENNILTSYEELQAVAPVSSNALLVVTRRRHPQDLNADAFGTLTIRRYGIHDGQLCEDNTFGINGSRVFTARSENNPPLPKTGFPVGLHVDKTGLTILYPAGTKGALFIRLPLNYKKSKYTTTAFPELDGKPVFIAPSSKPGSYTIWMYETNNKKSVEEGVSQFLPSALKKALLRHLPVLAESRSFKNIRVTDSKVIYYQVDLAQHKTQYPQKHNLYAGETVNTLAQKVGRDNYRQLYTVQKDNDEIILEQVDVKGSGYFSTPPPSLKVRLPAHYEGNTRPQSSMPLYVFVGSSLSSGSYNSYDSTRPFREGESLEISTIFAVTFGVFMALSVIVSFFLERHPRAFGALVLLCLLNRGVPI